MTPTTPTLRSSAAAKAGDPCRTRPRSLVRRRPVDGNAPVEGGSDRGTLNASRESDRRRGQARRTASTQPERQRFVRRGPPDDPEDDQDVAHDTDAPMPPPRLFTTTSSVTLERSRRGFLTRSLRRPEPPAARPGSKRARWPEDQGRSAARVRCRKSEPSARWALGGSRSAIGRPIPSFVTLIFDPYGARASAGWRALLRKVRAVGRAVMTARHDGPPDALHCPIGPRAITSCPSTIARPDSHERRRTIWTRRRRPTMTDEHAEGAINKARGSVEEGLGRATGDRKTEVTGKARQVEGATQSAVGDAQEAIRRAATKR